MKVSIIIPAYNEEKTLPVILEKVINVKLPWEREIIVVDDGSTDMTPEVLKKLLRSLSQKVDIKAFSNPSNMGKGYSIKHGIKYCTGDVIIIQDADLEYDPEDYISLITPIVEGKTKVVYGSRLRNKKNKHYNIIFLVGSLIVTLLTDILYFTFLTDQATCYKVFHKELKHILLGAERNGFDWEPQVTARILKRGYRIIEVPIRYYPRKAGEGKKIKLKDGFRAIFTIIAESFKK